MHKYFTHTKWLNNAVSMSKSVVPDIFSKKVKWMDQKPILANFLCIQSSHWSIPLSCIACKKDVSAIQVNTDFINDYINEAPLTGISYTIDLQKVCACIAKFVTSNVTAEQNISPFKDTNGRCFVFIALRDFYKGVDSNSKAIA